MKRILTFILVLSLLVLTGTLVSADGKTHINSKLGRESGAVAIMLTTNFASGLR